MKQVRPPIAVKVGRIVLNPPELAKKRGRQWNRQWTQLIGLTASTQALGSWGTKNPTCDEEHQTAVARS